MLNVWCSLWDLKLAIIFSLTSSFTIVTLYLFWVSSSWGVLSHMWPFLDSMRLPPSHGCLNDIFQVSLLWLFCYKMHPTHHSPYPFSLLHFSLKLLLYIYLLFICVCPLPPTRMKVKGGRDFSSLVCLQHLHTVGTSQLLVDAWVSETPSMFQRQL